MMLGPIGCAIFGPSTHPIEEMQSWIETNVPDKGRAKSMLACLWRMDAGMDGFTDSIEQASRETLELDSH